VTGAAVLYKYRWAGGNTYAEGWLMGVMSRSASDQERFSLDIDDRLGQVARQPACACASLQSRRPKPLDPWPPSATCRLLRHREQLTALCFKCSSKHCALAWERGWAGCDSDVHCAQPGGLAGKRVLRRPALPLADLPLPALHNIAPPSNTRSLPVAAVKFNRSHCPWSPRRLCTQGFAVAVDPERGLAWAGGGEPRIKGFEPEKSCKETQGCRYTLGGSNRLLGVVGGRVLAADHGSHLLYWDIARWGSFVSPECPSL